MKPPTQMEEMRRNRGGKKTQAHLFYDYSYGKAISRRTTHTPNTASPLSLSQPTSHTPPKQVSLQKVSLFDILYLTYPT
jgi:hypothetical protein